MFPHLVRGYLHSPTLSYPGALFLLYKWGKLCFYLSFMVKKKIAAKKKVVAKKKKVAAKKKVAKIIPVIERIEAKRVEIAGLSAERNMVSAKIKQASDELIALNVEERGV